MSGGSAWGPGMNAPPPGPPVPPELTDEDRVVSVVPPVRPATPPLPLLPEDVLPVEEALPPQAAIERAIAIDRPAYRGLRMRVLLPPTLSRSPAAAARNRISSPSWRPARR